MVASPEVSQGTGMTMAPPPGASSSPAQTAQPAENAPTPMATDSSAVSEEAIAALHESGNHDHSHSAADSSAPQSLPPWSLLVREKDRIGTSEMIQLLKWSKISQGVQS